MAIWRSAVTLLALGTLAGAQAPAETTTFHLLFLGHDIGRETDTLTPIAGGWRLDAAFHFVDRGTAIDLTASLDVAADSSPRHLVVKGRNYRLFNSDSEVTIPADGRARIRDLKKESDVALNGRAFFPVDNYAPVGVQEQLIRYWIARGKPAGIAGAPGGPIRIASRGMLAAGVLRSSPNPIEQLAIDGVVWGTEVAFVDVTTQELVALTTWAGALPFEAVRDGREGDTAAFMSASVRVQIGELNRLTARNAPLHAGTFALSGATVIDGTDRPPVPNATVLIRDNRIAAVGPATAIQIPRGTPTVDVHGLTIVPGLWDMHAHASQVDWAPVYLAGGVTTIRDMGGEPGFLAAFRDAIASGQALGPRVLLAGLVDGPGPQAFGAITAATPEEGIAVVRRYHDLHFDEMKIYSLVKPDVVKTIVDEAHRLGMTVTGHLPQGMSSQAVVEAGFDGIAHMQLRGPSGSDQSKQQLAFFKAHGTVMDPTQSWNELGGHAAVTPLESFIPGAPRLPVPLARMFASMPGSNGDPQAIHARLVDSARLLKDAVDAGLLVVAGTDKGVPGFSLQREIELYVEGGMTPLQAIQAATIMPARAMKLDKETGTIEVGKRADLVLLAGNPLDAIGNIKNARWVVANGRLYDCASLWKAAGYRDASAAISTAVRPRP